MHIATTDAEIEACSAVMLELRPHIEVAYRHARELGCQELHLDSGLQRLDAHRFYEREGMTITSYHCTSALPTP